ncbi:hypothetical protein CXB69_07285 [Latilactobacillus sakei]|nr:hypothetical protein CXB69_07285 [Latilactobacillus sakei]
MRIKTLPDITIFLHHKSSSHKIQVIGYIMVLKGLKFIKLDNSLVYQMYTPYMMVPLLQESEIGKLSMV